MGDIDLICSPTPAKTIPLQSKNRFRLCRCQQQKCRKAAEIFGALGDANFFTARWMQTLIYQKIPHPRRCFSASPLFFLINLSASCKPATKEAKTKGARIKN